MKKQTNNKYRGTRFEAVPKHKDTFPFHPGNEIAEIDRLPAYHGSGKKEYKRVLPPLRDSLQIDLAVLTDTIRKIAPANDPTFSGNSIVINGTEVSFSDGLANVKQMRFRYQDLRYLLNNLQQERILICSKDEILFIIHEYKKKCLKH
jgi:hypothetical protein